MKSCATLSGIYLLLFAVIGSFLLFYPIGFLYATYENLYGEWLQFSAFVGIAIVCVLIVKRTRSTKSWFWVLLGLGAFYTAMEEISWGQQLFGWKSGEFFQKQNLQGETNLHNMFTGPYSTITKDLLTYVLAAGMFGYGVIYPLLLRGKIRIATFFRDAGVPDPGLCLMPLFAVAAVCELSPIHFNEAELAELFVALAMCFVAISYYTRMSQPSVEAPVQVSAGLDATLSRRIGIAFVVMLISAFTLTQVSLHSSTSKKRVENRIEAGIGKFAGRYKRIKSWDHAIDLYQRHLAYDPVSRSRLRTLASAYRSAGRIDEQRATLAKVLELDLARLEKDPGAASVLRSLYRTYRAMGEHTSAKQHLDEALRINQERIARHPTSANAAYSMARTYDLMGRKQDAIAQYKRAFDLKPSSSKFRRAYRKSID